MTDGQILAFLGVALIVTITPGPDMALVTKHALASGRPAAYRATFGITTGLVTWAFLSAAGLAAILTASATAFTILKVAGGIYLVVIGLQAIWEARHGGAEGQDAPASSLISGGSAFRQGLLSNLLNPKVGIFYTSFLPQFISPGEPVLATSALLAGMHLAMGIVWLAGYIQLVVSAGAVLRRPNVRAWLNRVSGSILVGLGLRLAVSNR
jgi:threonine/homoserine/homoserine lactone efflux protein